MDPEQYATIGTDGTNPVIWGLGLSPELALGDAESELRAVGHWGRRVWALDLLTVVITAEQAQKIGLLRGVTTAESLGVKLPDHWLKDHGPKVSAYPESLTLEEESPWYYVEGVRYCKVCRTRRCEKQVGGMLKCPPEKV
jgi:hypothetical protein